MGEVRMTRNGWKQATLVAKQVLDDVTETYAGLIEASAAVVAPYEFGLLQDSIETEDGGSTATVARRRILVGQYYGLFQHEGTLDEDGSQRIKPNPFLADAVAYWGRGYTQAVSAVITGGW